MAVVLDASAMIALLRDEPGADVVEDTLRRNPSQCFAHAVNLCEVFYLFLRSEGEMRAKSAIEDLRSLGVLGREDLDDAIWQQAGRSKVSFHMSLADAFAMALADRFGAEVLTSDRKEFGPAAQSGFCKVRFFR